MSDYLHNKKTALLKYGRQATEDRKFRAPMRDTVYNPNLMGGSSCGDTSGHCNQTVKHNLFAARKYKADRPGYKQPGPIVIDFMDQQVVYDISLDSQTTFTFRFINTRDGPENNYIAFSKFGYDFTGATIRMSGVTITSSNPQLHNYTINFPQYQFTDSTLITLTVPTPIDFFENIQIVYD